MYNRLGAQNINGVMYALKRDVVDAAGVPLHKGGNATPGQVALRADKRPRPLVLRAAVGDCLEVTLTNLLTPIANPFNPVKVDQAGQTFNLLIDNQVADRTVGFHPQGLELKGSIASDSSFVGDNASSLVGIGQDPKTYTFYAAKEGAFLAVSHGATFGSEGEAGNAAGGLIAQVNVQPRGALFFRSQLTEEELRLATTGTTATGQPAINYMATYPGCGDPGGAVWCAEGKAGAPIISMLDAPDAYGKQAIVHSDLDAIITGPGGGSFPASTYPLEGISRTNPTYPNRLKPFREFTSLWHGDAVASQAFPLWFADPVLTHTLHGVKDGFMINYGSGGIGSEIIANRLGVGPMHDCLSCAYEEFFLTSFTVGDPAQLVDVPANVGLEACDPALNNCLAVGPKATKVLFPQDTANVHHSYVSDHIKFRNTHAGPKEQHIFHLHNHQWLFNPNDDNSNYLDAQGIGPGSSYTYEIAFGGSGNRNKSAGDAIFHCHFYPHFAQGMWYMWRIHDTFEAGTNLAVSGGSGSFHANAWDLVDGTPGVNARALPDGEVVAGTPIPAVVPIPGNALAPMPGRVTVRANPNTTIAAPTHPTTPGAVVPVGSLAVVDRTDTDPALVDTNTGPDGTALNPTGLKNPGYPFWIAGIEHTVGQRPPTPPLDMIRSAANPDDGGWDGGLPRHTLDGYAAGGHSLNTQTRLDFSKVVEEAKPFYFPEGGTDVEKAVMSYFATRNHATTAVNLDGSQTAASFVMNGMSPKPGSPYADPCVDDAGAQIMTGVQASFFNSSGGIATWPVAPQYGSDTPRRYKGAVFQTDVVFNKVGYHFPQQRILSLWEDVAPTMNKTRPPEPMVLRLNTLDCAMYQHTNLVPEVYELDDYQVRTPTDIIGQHIHLPKWDLTTTDGAANGWNYEDGTLSPGAVRERIHAINLYADLHGAVLADVEGNPVRDSAGHTLSAENTHLEEQPHPFFGAGPANKYLGARVTLQRWFADPILNTELVDRGLGLIFTHDHYGPSTHQQVGMYATVLTEPAGSTWSHNETGTPFYTRPDGGPTSWQAQIVSDHNGDGVADEAFREFYFEFSDFQHAYQKDVFVGLAADGLTVVPPTADSFRDAINPSFRQQAPNMADLQVYPPVCPGGVPRPCPEAISADDPGMLVVNYRNEPVGLRVLDPNKLGPDGKPGSQADGLAGDLAFALQTRTDRAIPQLNTQYGDAPYGTGGRPALNGGVLPGDPFTPMIRAYPGDEVRVKFQTGGQEEEHNVSIHGVKWLQAGSAHGRAPNSGWRNSQAAGISEQFTFHVPITSDPQAFKGPKDYMYATHNGVDGIWSGVWGTMRAYDEAQADLAQLPNNLGPVKSSNILNKDEFVGVCPAVNIGSPRRPNMVEANLREYTLIAMTANELLGNPTGATIVPAGQEATMHVGATPDPNGGTLVYNSRPTTIPAFEADGVVFPEKSGPLHDPTALLYVRADDLEPVPGQRGKACDDGNNGPGVANPACQVRLKAGAPIEPPVLRAAAGECLKVQLFNRLPEITPDLAGWSSLMGVVTRNRGAGIEGMTTFQNNLIRPSGHVGLHAQLLEYDVTRNDGANVGINAPGVDATGADTGDNTVAPPMLEGGKLKLGRAVTYRWYAGHHEQVPEGNGVRIEATPIEFGAVNLMPADKIKQGQKGMIGAIVVEPEGSSWVEDAGTRASATVTKADGSTFRDFVVMFQKHTSQRYGGDGTSVENLNGEGLGLSEDSQDTGQMAINYGTEPLWYRFGLPPHAPFGLDGHGGVPNAHEAYSNGLVGGDPETPVFTANAGDEVRMRVLLAHGGGRGSTFNLHGHVWQRDPYLCDTADSSLIDGRCSTSAIGSTKIGTNPIGMDLGGQESVNASTHFEVRLPSAGGTDQVSGDYLFRDQGGFGNVSGMWGILRVLPAAQ